MGLWLVRMMCSCVSLGVRSLVILFSCLLIFEYCVDGLVD